MKLYNLFQEVILEETQKRLNLLSEGISDSEVKAAIKGRYNVNIWYDEGDGIPPTKRYVQIYTLNNSSVRVQQQVQRHNSTMYIRVRVHMPSILRVRFLSQHMLCNNSTDSRVRVRTPSN